MFDPFPYQLEGASFLASKSRALLADEMGVGKTGQSLMACEHVGAKRVLVMAPANVRSGWVRAIPDFMKNPLPAKVLQTEKDTPLATGFTICSYDLGIRKAMQAKLLEQDWDAVITDEEHYLKEPDSKRTQLVYGKGCEAGPDSLIANAGYFWALSGTPTPNHAAELYPLLRAFGLFKGSYRAFVDRYCITRETIYGTKIIGSNPKNLPELKGLIKQCSIRRLVKDVWAQRPELTHNHLYLDPSECDKELLAQLVQEEKGEEAESLRNFMDAVAAGEEYDMPQDLQFSRLRRLIGMVKMKPTAQRLGEELDLISSGKVLIFAIHREVVSGLAAELARFNPVILQGGMTFDQKEAARQTFIEDSNCRVLVANITVGGTGMDGFQHAASDVVFVEASCVPSDNEQATRRLYRLGQTKSVRSRYVTVTGTLDEQVQNILVRKAADIKNILE